MKTAILIPCMDQMHTTFVRSLVNMRPVGQVSYNFLACSLIYKARNDLASAAIKRGADYVLWLDSDMMFPPMLLEDLMKDIEGWDIVSGLYHMRRPPYKPVIWRTLRQGQTAEENENEDYSDHPTDCTFEVEGCGFGCVLMRTKVLEDVIAKYHEAFAPLPGYGEDLSFCIRARACGYRIWVDPRIEVGHTAETIVTSNTFNAFMQANRLEV